MPGDGGPTRAKVDRDVLHRTLWMRADNQGVLKVHQGQLATALGITKFTMSRIIAEMVAAGRLRKLSTGKGNVARYVVTDPSR